MKASLKRLAGGIAGFLSFFLLVGFVVSCCFVLFLTVMANQISIELSADNLNLAAKLTFVNVLFLSLLFCTIDTVRRHYTVEKPVKQILDATNALTKGDFSVRIPELHQFDNYGFNAIIRNFNHMAQELSGIETLRTDFIANVSHELKTPLGVMRNYAVLLQKDGLSDEERAEYAGEIVAGSRRLGDLVTNILKLNKLENQSIFPETTVYDLGEQVCQCLLQFEEVWEKKEIEIETDILEGLCVRSAPELMALVWNNLFSNAIKFTPRGGTVSVCVREEQGKAIVSITDTGCGISAEVGAHIFDKFFQGDTSHAAQGNGLGLALVKRVIDITGSEISVESEVGKGSTFTVKLRRLDGV